MRTLALAALLLIAVNARAQTPADVHWTPFLGCWDLVSEARPESSPADAQPVVRAQRDARVCVEPQGPGVTMTTRVGEQPALTQSVVAGASARPIADGACRGSESAEWSADGRRLFSRAVLTCPGEPDRAVSGVALLSSSDRWIDVQAVTAGGQERVRVRHYRRSGAVSGQADQAGRRVTSPVAPMTVEGVIEASRKISDGALEAALIESRAHFALSGKTLLALDKAGVSDGVTDLMVALSYPKAFVVERAAPDDRLTSVDSFGYMGPWDMGDPFGAYGAYFPYGASSLYFDSGYYYSPFGYSYLRAYPVIVGSTGGVLGSTGAIGGAASGSVEGAGRVEPGRVINGLGYTRVTPTRATETSAADGSSGSPRSSPGRAALRPVTSDSGSGSGSSGSSSASGGSASAPPAGDTGRTAVPR
jgi:hypothetical protein